MFDIADTLEDVVLKTKKLCNKIEMSVDGCDDIIGLRKIFHIHRHLRDILRELESDELESYESGNMIVDGLRMAFEKALNV